eukprot:TRINITY_DN47255_c0_g1_i1.p1 TRINITY_DN47255_c0_g1~~TRINITY_DN47255_c0_g1_i1.p1  ORF type:complete len:225 (+),score=35.01 TRINITY_DN47255_c0_g1_i1:51-725(+)
MARLVRALCETLLLLKLSAGFRHSDAEMSLESSPPDAYRSWAHMEAPSQSSLALPAASAKAKNRLGLHDAGLLGGRPCHGTGWNIFKKSGRGEFRTPWTRWQWRGAGDCGGKQELPYTETIFNLDISMEVVVDQSEENLTLDWRCYNPTGDHPKKGEEGKCYLAKGSRCVPEDTEEEDHCRPGTVCRQFPKLVRIGPFKTDTGTAIKPAFCADPSDTEGLMYVG